MTDNDKKLVKQIRNDATYMRAGGLRDLAATMTQVADRIEALSTEVEDYRMAANAEASGLNDYKTRVHVLENTLKDCLGSLVAATWLLENGGKKAAASDTIFNISLSDYNKSIERGQTALGAFNG